jgi:hypothetical protein
MSRPTLAELRVRVVAVLDDEWTTPTEFCRTLGVGNGVEYYQVSLICERLANDGIAELQHPGSTVRRFRRRRGDA